MLITLSGLDGAGKSTVIATLRSELERQRRPVTVLHLNDHVGVYAWLRALRDRLLARERPLVEAPPRMTPSPTLLGRLRDTIVWSAGLRRLLYPLDLLFFLAVRLYVEAIRGRILIVDRYFYDRLVDVAPHGKRGWGWLRLLARITPKPDVAVLLEISAAEAFARKGEYTIPYLARREAAYARVFAWSPAAVRLSGRDPQAAARELARAVGSRTETPETVLASVALRLLLTQDAPSVDPAELDWAALRTVAKRGGVLVTLADAMTRRGEMLPPRFTAAAADACVRTAHVLELVDRLGNACTRHGIAHAFLKTVERYPDTGRDVDLLVGDASPAVDRLILRDVPAAARTRGFRDRLEGATRYTAAYGIVIDIRHGRLGRLGEHARYARILLDRAGPATAGAIMCRAPSPEDNLLLLAAQQIYVRPAFRLAAVYGVITTLRDRQLNWDYIFATAVSMGLVPTVGAYLEYIDRIHVRLLGRPLVAAEILTRFRTGAVAAEPRSARYPDARAAARLYLTQIRATLESGRWHSAARLSLLPVVAALAVGNRRAA